MERRQLDEKEVLLLSIFPGYKAEIGRKREGNMVNESKHYFFGVKYEKDKRNKINRNGEIK